MTTLTLAFFGDVVGDPGRRAFTHASRTIRDQGRADIVIVNGENAKHGSGLSADNYRALRDAGADAVTLGDHCFREKQAIPLLDSAHEPVARPANLAATAPGKRAIRLPPLRPGMPAFHVVTVLGRLHMPVPADDPFAAIDRELSAIADAHAVALVEIHAELTSEKQAVAWHCARKWGGVVLAVVGTHTHVQSADARILEGRVAAVTDAGMCGPHRSILGRRIDDVLRWMTTQSPTVLDVADGDERASGVLVRADVSTPAAARALSIEPFSIPLPA